MRRSSSGSGGDVKSSSEEGSAPASPSFNMAVRKSLAGASSGWELENIHILVVDDDAFIRDQLTGMLGASHYMVTMVENGRLALKLLETHPQEYDLILADVLMPEMDGLELLRAVRSHRVLNALPVVMMSRAESRGEVAKYIENGADSYLLKPLRIQEVKMLWQHVLNKRKQLAMATTIVEQSERILELEEEVMQLRAKVKTTSTTLTRRTVRMRRAVELKARLVSLVRTGSASNANPFMPQTTKNEASPDWLQRRGVPDVLSYFGAVEEEEEEEEEGKEATQQSDPSRESANTPMKTTSARETLLSRMSDILPEPRSPHSIAWPLSSDSETVRTASAKSRKRKTHFGPDMAFVCRLCCTGIETVTAVAAHVDQCFLDSARSRRLKAPIKLLQTVRFADATVDAARADAVRLVERGESVKSLLSRLTTVSNRVGSEDGMGTVIGALRAIADEEEDGEGPPSSSSPSPSSHVRSNAVVPPLHDFRVLKFLSKGAYGSIYITRQFSTGEIFALKAIPRTQAARDAFLRERDLMVFASHATTFVPKVFYSLVSDRNFYLVMEFLQGGDLFSLLQSAGFISETQARKFIAELIVAIGALHGLGIVHRDVKPDNIVVDAQGHIRLLDFGLSRLDLMDYSVVDNGAAGCTSTHSSTFRTDAWRRFSNVGTADYVSPEMLFNGAYGPSTDWWSVGVVMYELLAGVPPFDADTEKEVFANIKRRRIRWPAHFSPEARDLISRFLTVAPQQRLQDVEEIKAHAWFDGVVWEDLAEEAREFTPLCDNPLDTRYFDSRNDVFLKERERAMLESPTTFAGVHLGNLEGGPRGTAPHAEAAHDWRRYDPFFNRGEGRGTASDVDDDDELEWVDVDNLYRLNKERIKEKKK